MNFKYDAKDDCYYVDLDERESAQYEEGEDAQKDLETQVKDEISTRNIDTMVYVFHVNGTQIWTIE
jgi:hypothetical protein